MLSLFVFIIGSCIGSFLNVLIYRLPRAISIIRPSSFCPYCHEPIKWYDNIPILSSFLLRFRCRHCAKRISFRYVIVESLTGLLFLFLYRALGLNLTFAVLCLYTSLLIVASFTDLEYRLIPDEISMGGIFLGLILSFIFPWMHASPSALKSLLDSLLGIIIGGFSLYITGLLGSIIFKKEAMGGGDIKFLAMMGAFWGWKLSLFSFLCAPFMGSIIGLIYKIRTGKSEIPYGPFLAIGGFLGIFFKDRIFSILWGI